MQSSAPTINGVREAHVWDIPLDSVRHGPEEIRSLLSEDERLRASRFHFPLHRHRWIASRMALRDILARYVALPADKLRFAVNDFGKPRLANPPGRPALHFNLSHSEGKALLVVSREPVGIDIEFVNPHMEWQRLATHVFTDLERSCLAKSPDAIQRNLFFQLWTRKEAFIKARGLGFTLPLKSCSVAGHPLCDQGRVYVDPAWDDRRPWYLFDLTNDGAYRVHLAFPGVTPEVVYRRWR
jgi:4'-phosphopantetheinyl transferase